MSYQRFDLWLAVLLHFYYCSRLFLSWKKHKPLQPTTFTYSVWHRAKTWLRDYSDSISDSDGQGFDPDHGIRALHWFPAAFLDAWRVLISSSFCTLGWHFLRGMLKSLLYYCSRFRKFLAVSMSRTSMNVAKSWAVIRMIKFHFEKCTFGRAISTTRSTQTGFCRSVPHPGQESHGDLYHCGTTRMGPYASYGSKALYGRLKKKHGAIIFLANDHLASESVMIASLDDESSMVDSADEAMQSGDSGHADNEEVNGDTFIACDRRHG